MKISGSGHIPAGEYNEEVSISGSGKIDGNLRCLALSCSGSVRGAGEIECTEDVKVSGSGHFEKSIRAKNVAVSGSARIEGNITAENTLRVSGSVRCGGDLKSAEVVCSGGVEVGGGIEAESFRSSGRIVCGGLLNAEKIDISLDGVGSRIGSIGGSDVKIYCERTAKKITRLPLFSKLVGGVGGTLTVDELIEGDTVAIECVRVPKVVGRIVAIGADCEIDLVQYSEEIEIHPDAKIGTCEKI